MNCHNLVSDCCGRSLIGTDESLTRETHFPAHQPQGHKGRSCLKGPPLRFRIVRKIAALLRRAATHRSITGIICVDISEFESYMPSHAVSSLCSTPPPKKSPAAHRTSQHDASQPVLIAAHSPLAAHPPLLVGPVNRAALRRRRRSTPPRQICRGIAELYPSDAPCSRSITWPVQRTRP
jgi:hypothetical protein